MSKDTDEGLNGHLEWARGIEPPVPGMYYIDMIPNIDTQAHDPSLDKECRKIHTPFLDCFPVDILQEVRDVTAQSKETWLRKDEQIDSRYYREQSERRDCIKRDEANSYIEDVQDYQKYINETFNDIDMAIKDCEVVEEYPLFPAADGEIVLINGDIAAGESFVRESGESTLVDRCLVEDKKYECIKQSSMDNIVIEIKEGKAYYSHVSYIYKFNEVGK